ncbi:MAG: hypothetical protein ABWZ85_02600, partial [Luteibacter sp.]
SEVGASDVSTRHRPDRRTPRRLAKDHTMSHTDHERATVALAALSSGWLLVAFAAGMSAGPGVKTAFNASVFAAAAAAFLLAGARPDRWSVDGRRMA